MEMEQVKPMPIIIDESELRLPNEKAEPSEVKNIIERLEASLEASETSGIGLAAPQIGIRRKIAIIRYEDEQINLVNPCIVSANKPTVVREEGCLSLPDTYCNTMRYKEIVVEDDLNPGGMVLTGMLAIVAQHEIDHVESILITDRAVPKKTGRNDPCPCGATKNGQPVKFKKCHGR